MLFFSVQLEESALFLEEKHLSLPFMSLIRISREEGVAVDEEEGRKGRKREQAAAVRNPAP